MGEELRGGSKTAIRHRYHVYSRSLTTVLQVVLCARAFIAEKFRMGPPSDDTKSEKALARLPTRDRRIVLIVPRLKLPVCEFIAIGMGAGLTTRKGAYAHRLRGRAGTESGKRLAVGCQCVPVFSKLPARSPVSLSQVPSDFTASAESWVVRPALNLRGSGAYLTGRRRRAPMRIDA